jgi:hypothetical protein
MAVPGPPPYYEVPPLITYSVDFQPRRSRLTNFFRGLLSFPLLIVLGIYGFGVFFMEIGAWFALLFTARYPQGIYDFMVRYVRFAGRVSAYRHHMTDVYPPFNGHENPQYPVHIQVSPPLPRYSRVIVFFHGYYIIPLIFMNLFINIWEGLCSIASFWVILFKGEQSPGLFKKLETSTRYSLTASTVYLMMAEKYPRYHSESGVGAGPTTTPPVDPASGGIAGPLTPAH